MTKFVYWQMTALLVTVLAASTAIGDETTPAESVAKKTQPTETVVLKVELLDTDGQPVSGASVRPYGLRSNAASGSHFFWNPEKHGAVTGITSDANGIASISVPVFVAGTAKTSEVSLQIQHEDYIEVERDFAVQPKTARVSMQRGLKYRVRGIDASTGEPIRSRLYGEFSGRGGGNEWKQLDDGTLRSVAVTDERKALWLFHVPQEGPVQFSDVFLLSQLEGDQFEKNIPDMKLRPGHRLEGRLDDTVERPVKNGHVVLRACTSISDEARQLSWSDFATVNEDGSFLFESVPRDCILMMVAVCDGALSGAALTDELAAAGVPSEDYRQFASASQAVPFVVRSRGDSSEVVIPMGPTATVTVKVVDQDNQPLAGARVAMWPNQVFPGFGSNMIGDAWSTAQLAILTEEERIRAFGSRLSENAVKDPILARVQRDGHQFYLGTSDKDGMVTLRSLPGSSDASMPLKTEMLVQRKGYKIPEAPDQILGGNVPVNLVAGQTTELTVSMVPESASEGPKTNSEAADATKE